MPDPRSAPPRVYSLLGVGASLSAMILILSRADDVHVGAVGAALDRRDAAWARFDPADFPGAASLHARFGGADGRLRGTLRWSGHEVDLATVRAVYFRRPGRPRAGAGVRGIVSEVVQDESADFVLDLFDCLDAYTFPGPRAVVRRRQLKVQQLRTAIELGFEVPETVVGNEPALLPEMFRRHSGRLVSKLVGTAQLRTLDDGETAVRYTQVVRPRDLVRLGGLRACPVTLQAYVPKEVELRVTVVQGQVFAAAIHSQGAHHTRHDWRRYDHPSTRIEPWSLPHAEQRRCVALVRRMGLDYGAIDLILTPEGRYVFLEINPTGQFLWIERATGLAISEAVAAALAEAPPVTATDARSA